ncbi:MAG: helix-hairpin-helix domain-containing protein, partial [Candidatus Paceibacterota bacterium]
PEIFEVHMDLRPKNAKKFVMPTSCPECNSQLVRETVGKSISAAWYCKNPECPAKHLEGLIHFVSKKGLNIEGLGEKIIEAFRELGLITDQPSIFRLKKEDIEGLEGFGEKSAENIIASINASRQAPLGKFLYSLGIRHVGETTAKDVAKHFGSIASIRTASYDQLLEVEGIGEKVAQSMVEYFSDASHQKLLDQLLKEIRVSEEKKKFGGKLTGLTFVITGSFATFSRDEAKELIEENGGKVSGSVSKVTSYLLAGEGGGGKRDDAKKFGTKILTEKDLRGMLE